MADNFVSIFFSSPPVSTAFSVFATCSAICSAHTAFSVSTVSEAYSANTSSSLFIPATASTFFPTSTSAYQHRALDHMGVCGPEHGDSRYLRL